MSAHHDSIQFETVLSYCFTKTRSKDYDQAMHYGRLSGFFDDANKLTPTGSRMAVFLFDDCKAA